MDAPRNWLKGLRVLVVEDEALIAAVVSTRLTRAGCSVVGTEDSGMPAVESAIRLRPDMILMDIGLKGPVDGIEAAAAIHQRLPVPVVFLTAHSDQATLQRAKAASEVGFVLKPIHFESLLVAMELALHRFQMEQLLEESRLTHAAILGSIADGVITTDVKGNVRFMNAVAERITGWVLGEAQGRPSRAVVRLADRDGTPRHDHIVGRALQAQAVATMGRDDFITSRDGKRLAIDGSAAPVIDNLGRLVGATITFRDVSDVRRSETALRTMARRLQTVVDTAVDGVILFDETATIIMFNPACVQLFGYSADEVIGRPVYMLMHSSLAKDTGEPTHTNGTNDSKPHPVHARPIQGRRKDGTTFPAEFSIGKASDDGTSLFVGIIHDVSERRELEAALLDAIGHEQRKLGRDLHDSLGQELTALSLLVAAMARNAREGHLAIAADLERALVVAKHTFQSCRSVARGLSPIDKEHGGLVAGLRDLVARLGELPGPKIRFSAVEAAQLGLTPATTDHLYRIAQEALANALKHSQANSINVILDIETATVRLEICDDGTGVREMPTHDPGLGLRTMRYRASLIGARFRVAARSPSGTCVVCECPQTA